MAWYSFSCCRRVYRFWMGSSHESRDLNTEKRKKVQCKFVFFILQDIFEGNALCAQEFKSLSPLFSSIFGQIHSLRFIARFSPSVENNYSSKGKQQLGGGGPANLLL